MTIHEMCEETATINLKQAPRPQMASDTFLDTKNEIYEATLHEHGVHADDLLIAAISTIFRQ